MAATKPAVAAELTVFDGTATNDKVPAYVYYWDDFTRCQTVIPATNLEEMIGGTISALTFYTNTENIPYTSLSTADVYLMEVDYTTISAYEPKSAATMVYQGTFDFVATDGGGLLTITFTTPYSYDGGNLLIGIENTTDAQYKHMYFYGQNVEGASISGYSAYTLDNATATQRNFIPKTTFTYTPSEGPVYYKPVNLQVTDVASNSAKATWQPGGNETAWNLEYKKASDEEWSTVPLTATNYEFDGLANNTTYNVRVQGDYGNGNLSSWATASFTTLKCDDMGSITYNLNDSYGDGWNGASINVIDAATNEVIQTLTVTSQTASGTIGICPGDTYNFVWVSGNYDNECSFTINDPFGQPIYNSPAGNPPAAGQFASYTYESNPNPKPTNLAVSNVTSTTADATWAGMAQTYNLRYRTKGGYEKLYQESFENDLGGWTAVDNDGDEVNWEMLNMNNYSMSGIPLVAADGDYVMASNSYLNDDWGYISGDNWLISPLLDLRGTLRFYVADLGANFIEHFSVMISTSGSDPASFTALEENVATSGIINNWAEHSYDLTAYEGQQGYIAIRHESSGNSGYYLFVDAISLDGEEIPAGEWSTLSNVTSPTTIEGLTPSTDYEAQVQAIYEDVEDSDWTASVFFTTLEAPAPEKAYYLIGTFNEWDQDNMIPFVEEDGVFTLTYNFGGEFKIKDEAGNWWGGGVTLTEENPSVTLVDGNNLNLAQVAEYTLTIEDGVLTVTGFPAPQPVEYSEFYVVGSFNGWNQEEGNGRVELTANEDGIEFTGTVELAANDEFKIITPSVTGGWKWFGGQADGDFFLITNELLGGNIALVDGSNFKVEEGGEYTITVKAYPEDKGISEPLAMVITKNAPQGISTIGVDGYDNNAWYNLNGQKLNGKPTTPGIYINGHKKVVIK